MPEPVELPVAEVMLATAGTPVRAGLQASAEITTTSGDPGTLTAAVTAEWMGTSRDPRNINMAAVLATEETLAVVETSCNSSGGPSDFENQEVSPQGSLT